MKRKSYYRYGTEMTVCQLDMSWRHIVLQNGWNKMITITSYHRVTIIKSHRVLSSDINIHLGEVKAGLFFVLFVTTLFRLFLCSQQFKSSSSGCQGTWVQNHHHITSAQTVQTHYLMAIAAMLHRSLNYVSVPLSAHKGSEPTCWENILLEKLLFSYVINPT